MEYLVHWGPCGNCAFVLVQPYTMQCLATRASPIVIVFTAAILASGGSTPSAEEVSGVVYGLEQSTIAICSYTHGFTHGSGPSLKDSLKQRCSGLVEPTQELVAKLVGDSGVRALSNGGVHGMGWSGCSCMGGHGSIKRASSNTSPGPPMPARKGSGDKILLMQAASCVMCRCQERTAESCAPLWVSLWQHL